MRKFLFGIGLYTSLFYAYSLAMEWAVGGPVDQAGRFGFLFVGVIVMAVLTFALEIHDSHSQGYRADIYDIFAKFFKDFGKATKKFYQRHKEFKSSFGEKKDEIFPGCKKPTTILANMAAANIIQNPNQVIYEEGWGDNDPTYKWESASTRIWIKGDKHSVIVGGKNITLDAREHNIVAAALVQGYDLKQKQAKNKSKTDNQQNAVDAIEMFLGVGKE